MCQFLYGADLPAVGVVGLGIVAPRAVMGTALGKDSEAKAGTIHNGVGNRTGNFHLDPSHWEIWAQRA